MNLYVGFEFNPIEGWETIMPAPVAPSNYKDPAKKAAYVAKKIEELRDGKAAIDPLCGSIRRAMVLGVGSKAGKVKDLFSTEGEKEPGVALVEFLHRHAGDRFLTGNLTMFGHKIHRAMRLCAIECMAKSTLTLATQWLVELDKAFRYNQFPGYIDPVSIIFGSSDTDLVAAAKRLGVPAPDSTARSRAVFALALAEKLGF